MNSRRRRVPAGQLQQSSDAELSHGIEQALRRARFTPAQANCRAIAQTVVQLFG